MNDLIKMWLKSTPKELNQVFSAVPAGDIPPGDTKGTFIMPVPGSRILALITRLLIWTGKIFIQKQGSSVLINKLLPLKLTFVVALVYKGPSKYDNKEAIVIDYSDTSFFFGKVRDEIREISNGIYLGKIWIGNKEVGYFALEAKK